MKYEKRLEAFVKLLNETYPYYKYTLARGRRFDKIVSEPREHGGRSVWGFIVKPGKDGPFKGTFVYEGDLLMAASWKSPAAHARGNIYDSLTEGYGQYGPNYINGPHFA